MLHLFLKMYVAKATEFSNTNISQKAPNSNLYTLNLLIFYDRKPIILLLQSSKCWGYAVHLNGQLNMFVFGKVFLFVVFAVLEKKGSILRS